MRRSRAILLSGAKDLDLSDLPTRLGLTFVQFIKYENVIPPVLNLEGRFGSREPLRLRV